jgi:DUF1680 family protein
MAVIESRAKIFPVEFGETRWNGGFWGRIFDHCNTGMVLEMEKALLDKGNAAYLGNFDAASGRVPDRHYGTAWSDGDCYKWIEAVASVYSVEPSQELDALMDKYIEKIAAAQEADGYVCTQIQLVRQRRRWSRLENHELYNFGHLFTSAAVHNKVTGKTNFREVARKAGEYLYGVFTPRPKELVHFGFNPSQIMGCVDLYRATGDDRFLDLAEVFVDMRGFAFGGTDKHQSRVPVREEDEAVGHSVTGNYLWAGATDMLMFREDNELRAGLDRIWKNVVSKKMYVTGAVAPYYEGLSSRGDRISESFAWEYQLPNRRGYNETCANIAFAMWNLRLLRLTGEAQYADTLELVMHNSGISGASHDGTSFYYANPLARRDHALFKETEGKLGDNSAAFANSSEGERWKTHICYCCPPQYVRTVAQVHTWSYGKSDKTLWVHLYGDGQFDGSLPGAGKIGLRQVTNYPWEGTVLFKVTASSGSWTLNLRIPAWSKNAGVTVNGNAVDAEVNAGSYLSISREWKEGDAVEIDFHMEPVLMQSHPLVEENHGKVCVQRGPVIYCIESPEVPDGAAIDDILIPSDARLTPRYDKEFFEGATLFDVDALVVDNLSAADSLYYELQEGSGRQKKITMIPYYLWANRGVTEMSVWFPLAVSAVNA